MLEQKYSIHVSNYFNINHCLPEASQPFQSRGWGWGDGGREGMTPGLVAEDTSARPSLNSCVTFDFTPLNLVGSFVK